MDEKEEYISYRVTTEQRYTVYKTSFGGKNFYKICLKKKNSDGSELKIYRQLKFINCDPPENGDVIRITRAFEDNYIDPKNKYNDVCIIAVLDYEIFKDEEKLQKEAYDNFHRNLEENESGELDTTNLPF